MRPDADRVWKNKEVQSRFSRYFAIIKKEKVARYLITKKVPISVNLDNSYKNSVIIIYIIHSPKDFIGAYQ